MELDILTSRAGHHQSFDGTDFQCSAEPSHVTTSVSEKLMNEEVDEVTQQSDVDVLPGCRPDRGHEQVEEGCRRIRI